VKRSVVVQELASVLPLVGIALLFWFLMIRPAQRRQREVRQMQSSLSVGDEVMLTSGIYGVLQSLEDERVSVQVAPGVVVEVARGAVGARVAPTTDSSTGTTTDTALDTPLDTSLDTSLGTTTETTTEER
jgi:preprotein translocase subunit YajC